MKLVPFLAFALCLAPRVFAVSADALPKVVEFNRDIRPILSDNCFACHGPDKNTREADLRLDVEAGAFGKSGEIYPVVPGKPQSSEVFRRISTTDPDDHMPPS